MGPRGLLAKFLCDVLTFARAVAGSEAREAGVMMLAMALAHRQHATRSGGGWRGGGRREGSAQPPGLCTLLAAIALFLVLAGSATLGVESAVAAIRNTRSDRLPAYNSAATSWRFGGREAFANFSTGLELRVNGGAPIRLVPRNGTEKSGVDPLVPADVADARDDVARVRVTHALVTVIPRLPIRATNDDTPPTTRDATASDAVDVPPGATVAFAASAGPTLDGEGATRRPGAASGPARPGPAGEDGRGVAFAPFTCSAWSHSRVSARDRVDCDACEKSRRLSESADASARCAAACDDASSGRRFVARRAWVVAAELVVELSDAETGETFENGTRERTFAALPLRRPTSEGCALRYHAEFTSRAEWDTAAAVRAFCASPEGRRAPPSSAARDTSSATPLPLTVTVRSSRDPRVVAGALTSCSYDFGPSAREHASSAAFLLLLSFACVAAAAYWSSKRRVECFPIRAGDAEETERGRDERGSTERIVERIRRSARASRATPYRAYRVTSGAAGAPTRVLSDDARRRDRRRRDRRERDSAARVLELAETRGERARGVGV